MWDFCLQSLFREYGWQFFGRVALPHPLRTARAVLDSGALDESAPAIGVPAGEHAPGLGGGRSIVGLGFCLKPMVPLCPSGRPNHDCQFLENLPRSGGQPISAACGGCAIREIGLLALHAGAALYIMTSARDILLDVFVAALDQGRFTSGAFALCGYSVRPFAVGLLASGMRGWLLPFANGDCRDYTTWLRADRGVKDEQTILDAPTHRTLRALLEDAATRKTPATRFERRGHVLYPRMGDREPRGRNDFR